MRIRFPSANPRSAPGYRGAHGSALKALRCPQSLRGLAIQFSKTGRPCFCPAHHQLRGQPSTTSNGQRNFPALRCCAVALSSCVQPDVSTRPDFPTVPIVLRIVFSIVLHCSCAGGFSLAVARPCIVIGAHFPLQIDCICKRGGREHEAGTSAPSPRTGERERRHCA